MSKQTLNLGTAPAGVDGDTVRAAFVKTEANMAELYAWLGAAGSPAALPANLPVAKAFSRATILGTVSQSGGVPTGALIESGSNANGTYLKFADGTLICYNLGTATITTNAANGGMYVGAALSFSFPAAFVAVPKVLPLSAYSSGGAVMAFLGGGSNPTASAVLINMMGPSSTSAAYPGYLAIGRWFA